MGIVDSSATTPPPCAPPFQVHEHNPWVAYGEALHRVREFGAAPKLFDLLDERRFYPSEGRELVEMILGVTMRTDPGVDAKVSGPFMH